MLKVSKHPKKNREAYKTLMDAMVKGMSAGQIFDENPALFASVEKKAKDFSTVIQAGLSIEGVLLMQLLEALQNLEFLNARLVRIVCLCACARASVCVCVCSWTLLTASR